MSHVYQGRKMAVFFAAATLVGALAGCDNSTSKQIAENTVDPFTQALGADSMSEIAKKAKAEQDHNNSTKTN